MWLRGTRFLICRP